MFITKKMKIIYIFFILVFVFSYSYVAAQNEDIEIEGSNTSTPPPAAPPVQAPIPTSQDGSVPPITLPTPQGNVDQGMPAPASIPPAQAVGGERQKSSFGDFFTKFKENFNAKQFSDLLDASLNIYKDGNQFLYTTVTFLIMAMISWLACRGAMSRINKFLSPNRVLSMFNFLLFLSAITSWVFSVVFLKSFFTRVIYSYLVITPLLVIIFLIFFIKTLFLGNNE